MTTFNDGMQDKNILVGGGFAHFGGEMGDEKKKITGYRRHAENCNSNHVEAR